MAAAEPIIAKLHADTDRIARAARELADALATCRVEFVSAPVEPKVSVAESGPDIVVRIENALRGASLTREDGERIAQAVAARVNKALKG